MDPIEGDAAGVDTEVELFAALSTIARPLPVEAAPAEVPKRRRRSRFFFYQSQSFTEEVEQARKASITKKVVPEPDQIGQIAKALAMTLPPQLQQGIEDVRRYFLEELMPVAMSASTGSEQAMRALGQLLKAEVERAPFIQFEQMTRAAARMKMAEYLAQHFGLPEGSAAQLLEAVQPPRMMVPIPQQVAPSTPQGAQEKQKRTPTTPMMSKPRKSTQANSPVEAQQWMQRNRGQ